MAFFREGESNQSKISAGQQKERKEVVKLKMLASANPERRDSNNQESIRVAKRLSPPLPQKRSKHAACQRAGPATNTTAPIWRTGEFEARTSRCAMGRHKVVKDFSQAAQRQKQFNKDQGWVCSCFSGRPLLLPQNGRASRKDRPQWCTGTGWLTAVRAADQ